MRQQFLNLEEIARCGKWPCSLWATAREEVDGLISRPGRHSCLLKTGSAFSGAWNDTKGGGKGAVLFLEKLPGSEFADRVLAVEQCSPRVGSCVPVQKEPKTVWLVLALYYSECYY